MTRAAIVLGISGGTGSGKTTIAEETALSLGKEKALIINQDSYYLDLGKLPQDKRNRLNFDHPRAFDWKLLNRQIRALRSGRPIRKPIYDFHTHSRASGTVLVDPLPVVIVEGILVFADPELREFMDLKVFVDADPDIRFIRRLQRDVRERGRSVDSVIDQYLTTVRPMHREFIEPTKHFADIIVPEGGFNRAAIETILARVRSLLAPEFR